MRCVIVDDEKSNIENLSNILKQYFSGVHVIGVAQSAKEAIVLINKVKPELVFLDIKMPEMNGFQLLENLKEISFEIIFVTAFEEFALRAIKFSALDYLVKPIDLSELEISLALAEKRIQEKQLNHRLLNFIQNNRQSDPITRKLSLATTDRLIFVKVADIIRCEGEANYTRFHLICGPPILVSKTLKEYEELLTPFNFLRIHQSHLVNLEYVSAFVKSEGGYLTLNDGSCLSVARNRKERVLQHLRAM